MSGDQIFNREAMRARGGAKFAAGRSREQHGFNPGSVGIVDWQAEWDQAALVAKRRAITLPQFHVTGAAERVFDTAQAGGVQ
jgi:hypothetical protein